jgi:hypothetical protein
MVLRAGEDEHVGVVRHRTSPLQGGLPPTVGLVGDVVEIACDESGFSGSNLLDAATPVFTHASVDLAVDEAVRSSIALRSGFPCSLSELKSGQFLRSRQSAEALEWLLTALSGRAHVLLVDKEYFLVTRIVDLFLASLVRGRYAPDPGPAPAALALYRGRRSGGRRSGATSSQPSSTWPGQAGASAGSQRVRSASSGRATRWSEVGTRRRGRGVLDRARRHAGVGRLASAGGDDRSIPPVLEPMLPALAETVLFWSDGQRQVLVIHDEQSALTAGRLSRLQQALTDAPVTVGARRPRCQAADESVAAGRPRHGRLT